MTPRELAEKILRPHINSFDVYVWEGAVKTVESLLTEFQAETFESGIREGQVQATGIHLKLMKEAKASAYEEAAKVVHKECGNGCSEDHRKYIEEKIRALAEKKK